MCVCVSGLETNARPLARGELNSVRASGSSDLTSPVGEWKFYGDLSTIIVIASLALNSSGLSRQNEIQIASGYFSKLRYKILCSDVL